MKKILVLVLVLALAFNFAGCGKNNDTPTKDQSSSQNQNNNENGEEQNKDNTQQEQGQREPSGSITLGSTTQMNGNFWTSMWGNNAQDAVVKDLIHGYSTVTYQKETGSYGIDSTVVKDVKTTENEDGSKTFTMTLNENLKWNDGTQITAKDYVFYMLLGSSKLIADVGGDNTLGIDLVGYDEFAEGTTDVFSGVRLLGDYELSLTIKADKLPYFYDIVLAGISPAPMHVILPNADIVDDGNGAKITGEFTADVINETILNSETGYRYLPKVTCGPYQLDSFDITTRTAILKYNPEFIGDYNGQKPQIAQIVIKQTTAATQVDELIAGTVDILPQVGGVETLEPALAACDEGKISYTSFPRNGYGKITFVCDIGPTQFVKVRQAIAYCLDVPEFARQYSGGYASVVYGAYGLAQWMYQENAAKIESEFNKYALDLNKAKELLIEDGWTLNENGDPFVEGTDTLRYKMVDGELMPLIIKHLASTDNPVSALLSTMLPTNMESIGMKYEQTVVDFSVLLNNLYGQVDERQYNMMNLATGYYPQFDPYYSYNTDDQYMGLYNSNYIKDEELFRLATEMRETDPDDREGYSEKWYAFEKRWNELLPDIPLYSDEYHAFYSNKLKNYDADSMWTFQYAILYAYIEE